MPHPLFPRVVVHFAKNAPGDYEVFGTVKADYHSPWRTEIYGRWTDVKKAREIAHLAGLDLERRYHAPKPYELVHGASSGPCITKPDPPDAARRVHARRTTGRKRKTGRKPKRRRG